MSKPIDIKEIVTLLGRDAERICAHLLPSGRRDGADWVEASTSRGGLGDSLRICVRGAKQGVWSHFSANKGGDMLELISYVQCGGDKKEAMKWAKAWLGLDGDQSVLEQKRVEAALFQKKKKQEADEALRRTERFVKSIWLNAALLVGSVADRYLAGRAIDIRKLSRLPGALRFAPTLKHKDGRLYPAMVAAVVNHKGQQVAVHRTYLRDDGQNVVKAPLGDAAKMVLGGYAGGYIPLQRGASEKPISQAPADDKILICEGIEDGLSLALARPDYRVLAAISVGNFANIVLPPQIKNITIAADNDAPGSKAAKALDKAVNNFLDQGRSVFIAKSPSGKDFNDLLQAGQL